MEYTNYLYNEFIDYTNNLEFIEEQLIIMNENIVECHHSIINNAVNTLEILIILFGFFIGILVSFIFGVISFD